jgi:hypothetical protein
MKKEKITLCLLKLKINDTLKKKNQFSQYQRKNKRNELCGTELYLGYY